MMSKAAKADAMGAQEFRTWPVFRNVWKQQKFKDEYKKVFGGEFVPGDLPSKIEVGALSSFLSEWVDHKPTPTEFFKEIISK
jgi:hypothetical protein